MTVMRGNKQAGAISFLFIFLLPILVGLVGYSLYMGQQVDLKIEAQNSSDASVFAMTGHATQGLNMISANNLAIGGSLHVAGAVPILAAYGSIAYALTFSSSDSIKDFAAAATSILTMGVVHVTDDFQKNIWNKLAIVSSSYLRTAVGLTSFNKFLADYWLIPAPIRAVEMARLNTPDSIVVPVQKSLINNMSSGIKYQGLKVSTSKESLCHTLKSSEGVSGRDVIMNWIAGPLKTLNAPGSVQSLIRGLQKLNEFVNKYAQATISFVGCGYGIKSQLMKFIKYLSESPAIDSNILSQIMSSLDAGNLVHEAVQHKQINGKRGYSVFLGRVSCNYVINPAAELSRAKALAALRSKTSALELTKRALFTKVLKKMHDDVHAADNNLLHLLHGNRYQGPQKNASNSPYYCDKKNSDGSVNRLYDHIPHLGSSGEQCLNLRNLNYYCPLKKYISIPGGGVSRLSKCAKIVRNQMKDWKDNKCKWYDEIDKDNELQVVNWGKQIDSYMTAIESGGNILGRLSRRTSDNRDFGFTYIDDPAAFAESVRFASLVAKSADYHRGVTALPCKKEFQVEGSDGIKYCQDKKLVGFAPIATKTNFDHLKEHNNGQYVEELRGLSAGASRLINDNSSALGSSWGRSIWALSFSRAVKLKNPPDQAKLFWPDWFPQIEQKNSLFFQDMMNHILPSQSETNSTVAFLSLFQQ